MLNVVSLCLLNDSTSIINVIHGIYFILILDIPVKFTKTEAVIKEDENFVKLDVVREASGARNVKNVTLRVHEDPNSGGCLNSKLIYILLSVLKLVGYALFFYSFRLLN